MLSVLGIDAAWTPSNPSGFALAAEINGRWQLLRASRSIYDFCKDLTFEPQSGLDIRACLAACESLNGSRPNLVAVDMPLSRDPIVERRPADSAISVAYGSRHCSTHSPSSQRPGAISDNFTKAATEVGYPLVTGGVPSFGLIEVYPHPALVELTGAARRLPYKVGNTRKYWPDLAPAERQASLLLVWGQILAALDQRVLNVASILGPPPSLGARSADFKGYEDALDAVVCAWVGIEAMSGRAISFGNDRGAIWVPKSHRVS